MTLDAAAERVEMLEGTQPPRDARAGARSVARPFLQQAIRETFTRTGARVGLAWILLLVTGAVFAPWIANSFPLLVKIEGKWSSPLLEHLHSSDVILLLLFAVCVALLLTHRSTRRGVATLVWFAALSLPLTLWPAVVLDGWRLAPDFMSRSRADLLCGLVGLIDLTALALAGGRLWGLSRQRKTVIAISSLGLVVLLLLFRVHPPALNVYEQYRESAARGQLQAIVNAPVPFSPSDYQRDNPQARLQPPSAKHWMGTEQSGADVFSRMLHASRIALSIGFIATSISVVIGVTVGGLMGYYVGVVDILGMRVIEIIEAVPLLVLLLTVCAFFGRNLYLMMTVIGLLSWTVDARYVRAEFLRLRNQDFVQAARAAGLPLRSILFRHMLPNGVTPVLVNSSFNVAAAILIESVLSFLGLGLVDEPSWGQLLEQARAGGSGFQWWIATFPGLAIFLTVFSYNLIGEAMRDALDPTLQKRD